MNAAFAIAVSFCATQTTMAQGNDNLTFTVCALNVDGLPTNILGIPTNPDGKGAEGAKAIGSYLHDKGYDIVALSEDFNYHENLVSTLGNDYNVGTWRGGIGANLGVLTSFPTDGLCFLTKSPTAFSGETWTKWDKSYGKYTNGSDELINKGFRFYTVALTDGTLVDFYIMHMDADTDAEDIAARASQWKQLCNAVLAGNKSRPVVVMGDTNSRYTRDDIRSLFIDPITSDGAYSVGDAWVELSQKGTYPTLGDEAMVIPDDKKKESSAYNDYEIVDKVLYLNPTAEGSARLTPNAINFDAEGYLGEDGEFLGDHVPVVVTFSAQAATSADIPAYAPAEASSWWRGEEPEADKEAYIYNVGLKYFVTSDSKPVAQDIDNAITWTMRKGDKGYTFDHGIYRLYMTKSWGKWSAGIKENSGATTFSVDESDKTTGIGAYKLSFTTGWPSDKRYFNIDTQSREYTAAKTNDTPNDWLFISGSQKDAYDNYVKLFTQANAYIDNSAIGEQLKTELESLLQSTGKSNYSNYADDSQKLADIIERLKESVPTSVEKPLNTQKPSVVAIYSIDGKRVSHMSHGVNIVRMSDGSVRKIAK